MFTPPACSAFAFFASKIPDHFPLVFSGSRLWVLEQARDSRTASFLVNIERFGFFHYTGRDLNKCLDEEEYSLYLFSEKFQKSTPVGGAGCGADEKDKVWTPPPPFLPLLALGDCFFREEKNNPRIGI